jgi:hypothetical protein
MKDEVKALIEAFNQALTQPFHPSSFILFFQRCFRDEGKLQRG